MRDRHPGRGGPTRPISLRGTRARGNPARALGLGAGVVLLAIAGALPAFGHASFDRGVVPADSEEGLTMRVPVEPPENGGSPPLADRHNTRVTIRIPAGFRVLSCENKPGWSCSVNPASGNVPYHLRWTRSSGPPEQVDTFDFTVRTAKPGRYRFETNQTYSDGTTAYWDGPPDSPTPAPELEVK